MYWEYKSFYILLGCLFGANGLLKLNTQNFPTDFFKSNVEVNCSPSKCCVPAGQMNEASIAKQSFDIISTSQEIYPSPFKMNEMKDSDSGDEYTTNKQKNEIDLLDQKDNSSSKNEQDCLAQVTSAMNYSRRDATSLQEFDSQHQRKSVTNMKMEHCSREVTDKGKSKVFPRKRKNADPVNMTEQLYFPGTNK